MTRTAADPRPPRAVARWRPRSPFVRWPRATDAAVAVAAFLASGFLLEDPGQDLATRALGEVPVAALLVFAAASGALMWRRARPLEVLGVTLVASAVSAAFAFGHPFAHAVAVYSAGRYATNRRWNAYGLGAAMAMAAADAALIGSLADVVIAVCGISIVWYAGLRVRYRGERAALLEREQAAQGRRVLAEERARIARELHDVVAHRVSLMTVQAGAARTVAAVDPQGAVRAMAAVEEAGREALNELRHLLGVLRPDGEPEGLGPQPGLADVPRLVEQFKAAGLDVSLRMDGARTDLPARVDLFAYRIVQEAMTNVLKHAGPGTHAAVRLRTDHRDVAIEVRNDRTRPEGPHADGVRPNGMHADGMPDDGRGMGALPGSGHGIVGMRERALLLGGRLDASPRPGGGFQVTAQLPVGDEPAPRVR